MSRLSSLELDEEQAKLIANGGDIDITQIASSTYALYNATNRLLAIGEAENNSIHPIIVLL